MTADTPKEPRTAADLLEAAWGLIANASSGNWSKQSQEWQDAAKRWRTAYFGRAEARAEARVPEDDDLAGAVLIASCICTPDQFQLSGHGVNCPARAEARAPEDDDLAPIEQEWIAMRRSDGKVVPHLWREGRAGWLTEDGDLAAAILAVFPTTDGAGWDQLPHSDAWAADKAAAVLRLLRERQLADGLRAALRIIDHIEVDTQMDSPADVLDRCHNALVARLSPAHR